MVMMSVEGPARPLDGSRAREPDVVGFVVRDGIRICWESFGSGEPTILFAPTWELVHSRIWKAQIPDFARRHHVVTFDPRGNGRSDRPDTSEAYSRQESALDALAVLDAVGVERAIVVGWCDLGESLILAATHPERVIALALIAPPVPVAGREVAPFSFDDVLDTDEGWAKENRHYWLRDWRGYVEWFMSQAFSEPHSTKQIEDAVTWGLETDAQTILTGFHGWDTKELDAKIVVDLCARIRCPTLIIHGTADRLVEPWRGQALARELGASFVTIDGGGHGPHAREPIWFNLTLRDFVERAMPAQRTQGTRTRTWTRSLSRRRRALYISSPIGLGHAQRDAAIADELRRLHPDLEIDWLAQHPVTAVLGAHGERVHPLSAELASESAHITAESSEHDLNAFQAIRRMDEILVNNFMVFYDALSDGEYDIVIGDEAWDVDYYLHENPELKSTAFAWMTDFVGWLPMSSGGEREAFLTADYNAEMIEHVERFPRLRDRAIFVGDPDDIVPDDFGPGLPSIRAWTERHFDFSGYVTGFDPMPLVEGREELRRELGYQPDERVVIVTVGGSGVGEALLRRVVDAFPEAARRVNGLRMIAVTGPRIDPAVIGAAPGVEVRAFVPDLYKHLAASDLAVVQGGLTTTMELAAARRPFLYFPLRDHFEQNRHVRHRLDRYRAGRFMAYEDSPPETIADAIAEEIDRPIDYRPVAADGAARAASMIAEVL